MASQTIRISQVAHQTLKSLARIDGVSMQAELERAVESYRRQRFLEEANAAYERLRSDTTAWQDEIEERRAWDATLLDGQDSA